MSFKNAKNSELLFTKTNRSDRYKQMTKQQELIEEKKREIQRKLEEQKKKEAEEALKKIHSTETKPGKKSLGLSSSRWKSNIKKKTFEDNDQSQGKGNIFTNDGSFLDQFRKLSGLEASKVGKSDGEEDSRRYDDHRRDCSRERSSERKRYRDSSEERRDKRRDDRYRERRSERRDRSRSPPRSSSSSDSQNSYQMSLDIQTSVAYTGNSSQSSENSILNSGLGPPYSIPPPTPLIPQSIPPPTPLPPHSIPPPSPLIPQSIPPPNPLAPQNIPPPTTMVMPPMPLSSNPISSIPVTCLPNPGIPPPPVLSQQLLSQIPPSSLSLQGLTLPNTVILQSVAGSQVPPMSIVPQPIPPPLGQPVYTVPPPPPPPLTMSIPAPTFTTSVNLTQPPPPLPIHSVLTCKPPDTSQPPPSLVSCGSFNQISSPLNLQNQPLMAQVPADEIQGHPVDTIGLGIIKQEPGIHNNIEVKIKNEPDEDYDEQLKYIKSENRNRLLECKKEDIYESKLYKQGDRSKRKSRWGDQSSTRSSVKLCPTVLTLTPPLKVPGMTGPMICKVTRNDPGLLHYTLNSYGTIHLSEEDWKKAEDNYKIHLLYQDMMRKRAEVERLQARGQNKYEYDSDEEVDGGTWEHKAREREMIATRQWAESLTEAAKGKHHIGDFLPPEELKKFLEKYNAVKGGQQPDLSDYKEFKLKEDNKGFQMLQKLGWTEGQGLGSDGSGIVDPINKVKERGLTQGLGSIRPDDVASGDDEYEAYRKRMMLAYRFRPNPLNNPRRPYY